MWWGRDGKAVECMMEDAMGEFAGWEKDRVMEVKIEEKKVTGSVNEVLEYLDAKAVRGS